MRVLSIMDNGSTEGTVAYLSRAQDAAVLPVTLISNCTKRGFPGAIDQGLQYARGEYLLLNNDVMVFDAWPDQRIALAETRP
jgi:GT2 family glycosyltransferase